MKPKVKEEGILHKVKFSNWSTPIVPVVKPNGAVFICGEYKITVNPNCRQKTVPQPRSQDLFTGLGASLPSQGKIPGNEVEKYLLPRMDDIFAELWRKSHKGT